MLAVFLDFFGSVRFLVAFILIDESSEARRDSGGVSRPADANWSAFSKSSKPSSLRNSSSSNEVRSSRCLLLPR